MRCIPEDLPFDPSHREAAINPIEMDSGVPRPDDPEIEDGFPKIALKQ